MPWLPVCVWLIDITWYLNICRSKQGESFILEAEENREEKQTKTLFITLNAGLFLILGKKRGIYILIFLH